MKVYLTAAAAVLCAFHGVAGHAQTYPERPIRLVVPFSAGGPTDIVARGLAERLTMILRQPVVVDNKAGAGGAVGTEFVAKAAPDGYVMGLATVSTHVVMPSCNPKVGYNPVKDFEMIGLVADVPTMTFVRSDAAPSTIQQLAELARGKPGVVTYGTSGPCGTGHLSMERLNRAAGIQIAQIPYRGNSAATVDVLSGQITMTGDAVTPGSLALVKTGKVKALGVAWPTRIAALPDVPTYAEQGFPNVFSSVWYGVLVPAKTPSVLVARLNDAVKTAMQDQTFVKTLEEGGIVAVRDPDPARMRALIANEYESTRKLVRELKLSME
jgi:tripartite-type tricarboxylate transporter receptor subunit TctC